MSDHRLIHGDCLDVLPTLADSSIDLVLTDPPYGTTACKWDSVIPLEPMWAGIKHVIKRNAAVVLFSSQPFTSALVMSNPEWFRYEWVWDKGPGTGFLDAKKKPLKCHENVCVFYAEQPIYNPQKWKGAPNHARRPVGSDSSTLYQPGIGRVDSDLSGDKYPRSIVYSPKHTAIQNLHPTQKPVALLEYLIRTYTNPGDLVLDFTFGSCSTGVACLNTGRRFIGVEKDETYFEVGQDRMHAALQQLRLVV